MGIKYKKIPLTSTRKMVIASIQCNKRSNIDFLTKIEITKAKNRRNDIFNNEGEKISVNAYIIKCFAETFKIFPEMNSFIKGKNLIILEDINISLMVEREIEGINTPEPVCIKRCDTLSLKDVHNIIRSAQEIKTDKMGDLAKTTWIKFIPSFLFKLFVKLADRSIKMTANYGKIAVTSPGMFISTPTWVIPHGTATVFIVIGSIEKENFLDDEGVLQKREMLNVTLSFDHEIIDGAPAARFVEKFQQILSNGDLMC